MSTRSGTAFSPSKAPGLAAPLPEAGRGKKKPAGKAAAPAPAPGTAQPVQNAQGTEVPAQPAAKKGKGKGKAKAKGKATSKAKGREASDDEAAGGDAADDGPVEEDVAPPAMGQVERDIRYSKAESAATTGYGKIDLTETTLAFNFNPRPAKQDKVKDVLKNFAKEGVMSHKAESALIIIAGIDDFVLPDEAPLVSILGGETADELPLIEFIGPAECFSGKHRTTACAIDRDTFKTRITACEDELSEMLKEQKKTTQKRAEKIALLRTDLAELRKKYEARQFWPVVILDRDALIADLGNSFSDFCLWRGRNQHLAVYNEGASERMAHHYTQLSMAYDVDKKLHKGTSDEVAPLVHFEEMRSILARERNEAHEAKVWASPPACIAGIHLSRFYEHFEAQLKPKFLGDMVRAHSAQFMYHLLDASFRKTALICTGTDGVVDWDVLRPAMAALDEAYSASFTDDFEWDTVDEEDAPAAYDDYVDKVKEIVASHANGGRHENIATRVEDALKVKPNTLLLPLPCKSFVEILAERLRLAEHARFELCHMVDALGPVFAFRHRAKDGAQCPDLSQSLCAVLLSDVALDEAKAVPMLESVSMFFFASCAPGGDMLALEKELKQMRHDRHENYPFTNAELRKNWANMHPSLQNIKSGKSFVIADEEDEDDHRVSLFQRVGLKDKDFLDVYNALIAEKPKSFHRPSWRHNAIGWRRSLAMTRAKAWGGPNASREITTPICAALIQLKCSAQHRNDMLYGVSGRIKWDFAMRLNEFTVDEKAQWEFPDNVLPDERPQPSSAGDDLRQAELRKRQKKFTRLVSTLRSMDWAHGDDGKLRNEVHEPLQAAIWALRNLAAGSDHDMDVDELAELFPAAGFVEVSGEYGDYELSESDATTDDDPTDGNEVEAEVADLALEAQEHEPSDEVVPDDEDAADAEDVPDDGDVEDDEGAIDEKGDKEQPASPSASDSSSNSDSSSDRALTPSGDPDQLPALALVLEDDAMEEDPVPLAQEGDGIAAEEDVNDQLPEPFSSSRATTADEELLNELKRASSADPRLAKILAMHHKLPASSEPGWTIAKTYATSPEISIRDSQAAYEEAYGPDNDMVTVFCEINDILDMSRADDTDQAIDSFDRMFKMAVERAQGGDDAALQVGGSSSGPGTSKVSAAQGKRKLSTSSTAAAKGAKKPKQTGKAVKTVTLDVLGV